MIQIFNVSMRATNTFGCKADRFAILQKSHADLTEKAPSSEIAQVQCPHCYLDGHSSNCCPWQFTLCKFPNCDGIRHLQTSYTPKNYNRKILKCQGINYKSFEWLSDAVGQAKSFGGSSSSGVTSCFGCGGNTHWVRDCPWREVKCEVQWCIRVRRLCI
ncbi:hypothetical protein GIB67_008028 [Kingdonia uniflora]|uniref:CCHC-type domain-containing protein n=1 Tax=Kingdonia uniflora TaxID=39325 RepID=A0A7J7MNH0_9MAGN|nr:hypothetical protein GIB67_008028 [Kingdonia uniflora]